MKRFISINISKNIKDSENKKYQEALKIHNNQYIIKTERFKKLNILRKNKRFSMFNISNYEKDSCLIKYQEGLKIQSILKYQREEKIHQLKYINKN